MKILSCFLFAISFSNIVFSSDIPCNVIGTAKDPNLIKLLESKPGSNNPEESLLSYKDQYEDAVRCRNRSDAARFKIYIEGLEDSISRDKVKKTKDATTPARVDYSETKKRSDAVSPVVKKISIDCEDESTKPKTRFKIFGTDKSGAVVAEGYKDQMLVRLIFDNSKPDLGRTIEVVVNGQSNNISLSPGLGPIGFKPGFAMKLLLKAIGVSSDLKINCFPLSQAVIPEPVLAPPAKMVDDSSREKKKVFEDVEPANKNGPHTSSTISK